MPDHRISVCSVGMIGFFQVVCSCAPGLPLLTEDLAHLDELAEIAHRHMEETYPARLIEEMKRVPRITAKELGLTDEELLRRLGGVSDDA